MQASIVVVTWNGAHVLRQTLPRLLEAVRWHGQDHEVLVVDNGSTDETPSVLAAAGPGVRVLRLDANRGMAAGFNAGLRLCRHPVMVTLANDILVHRGFLAPLLAHFATPDVFAVSAKRLTAWNAVEHAHLRYRFDEHGLFDIVRPGLLGPDGATVRLRTVTWCAPWVNAAWRVAPLRAMGGFEERFGGRLGWWVEVDPSYRAWKRGWRVLFEPDSVVWHLAAQTGYRGLPPEENDFWFKEGLLFLTWANLTDRDLLERHVAALPALAGQPGPWVTAYLDATRLLLDGAADPGEAARRVASLPPAPAGLDGWPRALASVVAKLPWVIERRLRDRPRQRRTDAEVFRAVNR
jgi:GT2 family glycosyltransferase